APPISRASSITYRLAAHQSLIDVQTARICEPARTGARLRYGIWLGVPRISPTRSPFRALSRMQPGALRALEFDRIVEAVASLALTPMGDERLGQLEPSTNPSAVVQLLAGTAETRRYF